MLEHNVIIEMQMQINGQCQITYTILALKKGT